VDPYSVVFHEAVAHGILVGISLPDGPLEPPRSAIDRLHPKEREVAAGIRGYRLVSWIGGRLAAREALDVFGCRDAPLLSDARGAPIGPKSLTVSVSHKRTLAVALVARAELGSVGIDLEELAPARLSIQDRVLTDAERQALQTLPPERQWTALLLRFTVKEAIYKALAPDLGRYVGFEEAEVTPSVDGTAAVVLKLAGDPPPVAVEARYSWFDHHVLATVRARVGRLHRDPLATTAPAP
jgi:phosphopantetheine--protein transferase-like protein